MIVHSFFVSSCSLHAFRQVHHIHDLHTHVFAGQYCFDGAQADTAYVAVLLHKDWKTDNSGDCSKPSPPPPTPPPPGPAPSPTNTDCVGAWGTCAKECKPITYTIKTKATGTGQLCPNTDGKTKACAPGDDACPVTFKPEAPPAPAPVLINVTTKVLSKTEKTQAVSDISSGRRIH